MNSLLLALSIGENSDWAPLYTSALGEACLNEGTRVAGIASALSFFPFI
jgi:hypothetical protein